MLTEKIMITCISFLRIECMLFVKTWILFNQGCFAPSFVEIGPLFLKKIIKYRQLFSLFRYYLPFEKGMAHYLNKLEFSSHRDAFCQISFKLTQWFWRRRLFNLSMCFFYFFIISPWKRSGIFIWTNLNRCFVPCLIEISPVILEKKILKFRQFRYYLIISPWKRNMNFIWTNLNPLYPRMLCAKLALNWPSDSRWNLKSLQTDRLTNGQTTDNRRSEKAHFSFQPVS